MPSRRRRKSILSSWFGRKRREERGTYKSRRTVDANTPKEKSRRIRDVYEVLKAWSKRGRSNPISREPESLLSIIKDASVNSGRLEERSVRKRSERTRALARINRRESGSSVVRSLKRLAGAIPSMVMTATVAASLFDTPGSAVRRFVRSEALLEEAIRDGRTEEVDLILRKRLVADTSEANQGKLRYLNFLIDSGQIEKALRYARGIPFDSRERSGELQILAAMALARAELQDEKAAAEYESRLIIAVADPVTASRARAMLGRFYRERGQFEASESVLEPIRASESGCLELALLREAQGHYGDIPTTLAPYLVRWRERWLAPKSAADIESSAEALILMNQESVVLETLDTPPVPIAPEARDRIRTLAAKSLMDREFRSGTLRYSNALAELRRHFDRLPCSNVWVVPLTKLAAKDSPTRETAVELRDAIAFEKNCPPAFLDALAAEALKAGETQFATRVIASVLSRFPDDPQAREMQADQLLAATPPDLKTAEEVVEAVIRDHPDRGPAFEIRGRIREAQGRFADALADYLQASRSDARNYRLHDAIARISRRIGQADTARIHEQLAKELAERK